MKRIGIHQINYFPWIGYFNKMAKSDLFVYLDDVQLTDRGVSQRTSVLGLNGKETYLTVSVDKHGHREKPFKEILLNQNVNWQEVQINYLRGNYSKHPYYNEIMSLIEPIWSDDFKYLIDVTYKSVEIIKDVLGIETETIMQSELDYDRNARKNTLMLELTKSCSGDVYLSGNGARKYMNIQEFEDSGVKVQYLKFIPFEYPQYRANEFTSGMGILDLLFNVGISNAKNLFWKNIQNKEVFENI